MNATPAISLSQARAIVEQYARAELGEFAWAATGVLKDEYLEADHCWMYFRSDDIIMPSDAAPGTRWAYVVSKKGTFSTVQDFSGERDKLFAYLQAMSDYFRDHDE